LAFWWGRAISLAAIICRRFGDGEVMRQNPWTVLRLGDLLTTRSRWDKFQNSYGLAWVKFRRARVRLLAYSEYLRAHAAPYYILGGACRPSGKGITAMIWGALHVVDLHTIATLWDLCGLFVRVAGRSLVAPRLADHLVRQCRVRQHALFSTGLFEPCGGIRTERLVGDLYASHAI